MNRPKYQLFWLVLCLVSLVLLMGCASAELDRSYVNDPAMDLQKKSFSSDISPSTGLSTRNKSNGGSACNVCAH